MAVRFVQQFTGKRRDQADLFERFGCGDEAQAIRALLADLEQAAREYDREPLTLQQAAAESGYTASYLSELVNDGTLQNAGERYSPRIRRRDLPRKVPARPSQPDITPAYGADDVSESARAFRENAQSAA